MPTAEQTRYYLTVGSELPGSSISIRFAKGSHMARSKSRKQAEEAVAVVTAEQVVEAVAQDAAEQESRKQVYAVAEGTKLAETPADYDVAKHRTIRRKFFSSKSAWFEHRALVHRAMADRLQTRATELREHGDKEKARRRAAKLTAKLAALKAEFGDEILG